MHKILTDLDEITQIQTYETRESSDEEVNKQLPNYVRFHKYMCIQFEAILTLQASCNYVSDK